MSGGPQSLAALEGRANAGDAAAQFELAVALDRAGRRAEATAWLERAAEAGQPDALTLLAITDLQGFEKPRDLAAALARLRRAAAAGGNGARRLLALLTAIGSDGPPDWTRAVALVIEAAQANDPAALRELAFLAEMAAPQSQIAENLLVFAGMMGDGYAAYAVLRRQASGRALASEEICAQWRAGLVRLNHPLADRVTTATVSGGSAGAPPRYVDVDWEKVSAMLAAPPGVVRDAGTRLSERPQVKRFDRLMSEEECEFLIGWAARYLRPAEIVDQTSGQAKQSRLRTNSVGVLWPAHQDLVVHALNLRLAAATGLPVEHGEMINVLMYRPGEEYRAHFDFFPVETAKTDPSGQRIRTLLVFLNTDYEGGATHFINAGLKVKGEVGDAALFHNCDLSGEPDRTSLHAGMPVASGQKWLLSKWWREKRFTY